MQSKTLKWEYTWDKEEEEDVSIISAVSRDKVTQIIENGETLNWKFITHHERIGQCEGGEQILRDNELKTQDWTLASVGHWDFRGCLGSCGFHQNGASGMLPSLPGSKWRQTKMMERMVCIIHKQANIYLWKAMALLIPNFFVPASFQDHKRAKNWSRHLQPGRRTKQLAHKLIDSYPNYHPNCRHF